MLAVYTA